MFEELENRQLAVLGGALVAALAAGFAGATMMDVSASPTGNVAAAGDVSGDVKNFLNTVAGGQADIEVTNVEESDIASLYAVDFTASIQTPQGAQEQEGTVYVTQDGEHVFMSEPADLQNPPQPRMPQPAPEQPSGQQ